MKFKVFLRDYKREIIIALIAVLIGLLFEPLRVWIANQFTKDERPFDIRNTTLTKTDNSVHQSVKADSQTGDVIGRDKVTINNYSPKSEATKSKSISNNIEVKRKKQKSLPDTIQLKNEVSQKGNFSVDQKGGTVIQQYYDRPPPPVQRHLNDAEKALLRLIASTIKIQVNWVHADPEATIYANEVIAFLNQNGYKAIPIMLIIDPNPLPRLTVGIYNNNTLCLITISSQKESE